MFITVLALAAVQPTTPVWVYFKDKGLTPDQQAIAISELPRTYPQRAVERRRLRRTDPGLFDVRDLPVSDPYACAVVSTGAAERARSRWLNAMSVQATPDQVERIRALPFVTAVEPVRGGRRAEPAYVDAPFAPRTDYGRSDAQLTQVNIPPVHDMGFTGQGVIVGVLDTGFVTEHEAFHQPGREIRIIAARDFINDDDNVGIEPADPSGQHTHGTLILGVLGANYPGELVGGCPGASFILCKTEDVSSETPIEEDYYAEGLEFAEMHGADVCTSSLGYIDWYTQADLNGSTAVTTIAVNIATANGVHCCTAAGNEGHDSDPQTSHLIAPADAFRVITAGACRSDGTTSSFSSDGPTADGRVKPELIARGSGTSTINPDNPTAYSTASGTSLSTPVIAGVVATLTSARPSWGVDQMRSALFITASERVANGQPDPELVRGYGIPDALAALSAVCPADLNADGTTDFNDYLEFLNLYNASNPQADLNGDSVVDFNDYLEFLNFYNTPC